MRSNDAVAGEDLLSGLRDGPLAGVRVLELGSSVAGPFCGRLLGDFGADVVKVEPPQGDPVRTMSKRVDGHSLYAASILRNKRLLAVDLRQEDGQEIIRRLVCKCDVVIENFRPRMLEKWGLGYDALNQINPRMIMVRISGFGQSGPYSERPGYGVIGEAMSGLRHLTGDPDRPPGRINASVTDEVTGLYAAFGAVMALRAREQTGRGQYIDAALYESAFSLIEPHVPAFGSLGIVAQRAGSRFPDSTPNNLYPTLDGRHIHITAMADSVFGRLASAITKPELAKNSRFSTAAERSEHDDELDQIITQWTSAHNLEEIEQVLEQQSVPASRIYDIADIYADDHYRAREMLVEMPDRRFGTVTVAGIVPKLSETPGRIRHTGGVIGENTRQVLTELCGLTASEIDGLERRGIVVSFAEPKASV
jgi:crotonobetainyl-CoA:carnitine CoA-transferase CaiB-like acyl-CoA transferase